MIARGELPAHRINGRVYLFPSEVAGVLGALIRPLA